MPVLPAGEGEDLEAAVNEVVARTEPAGGGSRSRQLASRTD